ncbi:IS200/IS605 family transposase [Candidatus Woesearchaeota archaeon]|nr:IS200/IS605 family transposase [Candidatus Woesearchaeota archaeon]
MEFVKVELRHDNHKVGINYWHLEWVTKYRYQMFSKFKYQKLCEACIRKAAKRHNITIHIISVMSEHVHILVTLPKNMTDSKALQVLKGFSAYAFFRNHPKARLRYKGIFQISCSKNFFEIFVILMGIFGGEVVVL